MLSAKSASLPVGSVVGNSDKPVVGFRTKSEKVSGIELGSGAFVLVVSTKENLLPRVMLVAYSLKKSRSLRVTIPCTLPLAPPISGRLGPSVPFVKKSDTVTMFAGGPPSMKSNASCADAPEIRDVSTLIEYGTATTVAGANKMSSERQITART